MAIALKETRSYTTEDGRLKGKSKFWGFPDMPAGMEFPYKDGDPMCFICQINLEELHAQAADATDLNLLPRRGMLYFFAQIDYFLGWSRELGRASACGARTTQTATNFSAARFSMKFPPAHPSCRLTKMMTGV